MKQTKNLAEDGTSSALFFFSENKLVDIPCYEEAFPRESAPIDRRKRHRAELLSGMNHPSIKTTQRNKTEDSREGTKDDPISKDINHVVSLSNQTAESNSNPFASFITCSVRSRDLSTLVRYQKTMLEQVKLPNGVESTNEVWSIVQSLKAMVQKKQSMKVTREERALHQCISMVKIEGMAISATRFIEYQHQFRRNGYPTHVDIGYQYYWFDGYSMLNVNGTANCFATQQDIYTSDDPFAHFPVHQVPNLHNSRLIGFMVARLKGLVTEDGTGQSKVRMIHGHQSPAVVLNHAEQCLPLLCISPASNLVDMTDENATCNRLLHGYHEDLQKLLDSHCNANIGTTAKRARPSG